VVELPGWSFATVTAGCSTQPTAQGTIGRPFLVARPTKLEPPLGFSCGWRLLNGPSVLRYVHLQARPIARPRKTQPGTRATSPVAVPAVACATLPRITGSDVTATRCLTFSPFPPSSVPKATVPLPDTSTAVHAHNMASSLYSDRQPDLALVVRLQASLSLYGCNC